MRYIITAHTAGQEWSEKKMSKYKSKKVVYDGMPELWDITKNIEDQINKAFENEGAKNAG